MLRPERMSKVSVTGAKTVMDDVIEAVHDLNLVHLSNYDGTWEGFESGDPIEGADEASGKLVTIRSLENMLDVEPDDAGPERMVTDGELDTELERVRERANELDDRRSDLEDELRSIEERLDTMDPLVALGLDLDLLRGYESVEVAVGRGRHDRVEEALSGADDVATHDTFASDDGRFVAAFARPVPGAEGVLDDAFVGVDFERLEVPDADGPPGDHVDELRQRKSRVEAELSTVEEEIEDLKLDAAGFLLAAEEQLSVEVQKTEAPLSFATTENSFVAEGWVPTDRYDDLVAALESVVGDHVEIEEVERASYTEHGHPEKPEPIPEEGATGAGTGPAEDETVATDGGAVTMADDPPVILDNPGIMRPMEILVKTAERPKYTEFDPTAVIFLTFPIFFGFMIGDLGYGLLYMGIGYVMFTRFESEGVRSMGGLALWAGVFTAIFGVLYGELFGLHLLGEVVFEEALAMSGPPLHKGLQPKYGAFASAWLVVSIVVGVVHVTAGHVLGFLKVNQSHGLKEAVLEKGSWVLMLVGVWAWILSTHLASQKPQFLYTVFDGGAFALGFAGLPAVVGQGGLAAAALGFVMLIAGEGVLAVEFLQALVNALSYARLMAVLLAKAGIAFVVNLLVFGAYKTESGEFHFIFVEGESVAHVVEDGGYELMFGGLFNAGDGIAGLVGLFAGLILLVIGHLFVLALGVTSAGLQSVRLEYVEFFGKFYDGGGRTYDPFGYRRKYTAED